MLVLDFKRIKDGHLTARRKKSAELMIGPSYERHWTLCTSLQSAYASIDPHGRIVSNDWKWENGKRRKIKRLLLLLLSCFFLPCAISSAVAGRLRHSVLKFIWFYAIASANDGVSSLLPRYCYTPKTGRYRKENEQRKSLSLTLRRIVFVIRCC